VNAVLTHSGVCLPSTHAALPTAACDGAAALPKRMQAASQAPQNSCLVLFLTLKSSATYALRVPLASPVCHVNAPQNSPPALGLSNLVLLSLSKLKQRPQASSSSPVGLSTSASPETSVLVAAGADLICIRRWLEEGTALLILQWLSVTTFSHPQHVEKLIFFPLYGKSSNPHVPPSRRCCTFLPNAFLLTPPTAARSQGQGTRVLPHRAGDSHEGGSPKCCSLL